MKAISSEKVSSKKSGAENNRTKPKPANVLCDIDNNGVATLTLNRESKSNAFNDDMIIVLIDYLNQLAANPTIRCLLLRANGKHFSSGADLQWMQSMVLKSKKENRHDAKQLADLLHTLDSFPHPTIVVVQGYAFGGALGLICCCDIAVSMQNAKFCLSEVKLGLIPATIAPYVCRAMGVRHARRYMLTAEQIDASTAAHIGLVHIVINDEKNAEDEQLTQLIKAILASSPMALQQAKILCHTCDNHPIDKKLIKHTSHLIADIRVSEQGQEGLNAFLDKRSPSWLSKTKQGKGH